MWVKICGMTSPQAVDAALQAGADAVGFVFSPSVRRLELAQAVALAAPARGRALCVAVTLHPPQGLIDQVLQQFGPDVLQTDLADLAALRLPASLGVLPVLRAGPEQWLEPLAPRILFEGPRSGAGSITDWAQAMRLARQTQLILAGGLTAMNVADAIRAVQPFGVDVSSGVEAAPGRKDPQQILEFVRAARAAPAGGEHEHDRNRR